MFAREVANINRTENFLLYRLDFFRVVSYDIGMNKTTTDITTTSTFRVEYLGRGGSWGSVLIESPTTTDAEERVLRAAFVDPSMKPKATHKLDSTGLVRIAL